MSGESVVDEVEGQGSRPDGRAGEREAQAEQRIDEALFRALEAAPGVDVLGVGEVGDGAVECAGRAEGRGRPVMDEPVATARLLVGAISIARICSPAQLP